MADWRTAYRRMANWRRGHLGGAFDHNSEILLNAEAILTAYAQRFGQGEAHSEREHGTCGSPVRLPLLQQVLDSTASHDEYILQRDGLDGYRAFLARTGVEDVESFIREERERKQATKKQLPAPKPKPPSFDEQGY